MKPDPIRVHVTTSPAVDDFGAPGLRDRRKTVRHLLLCLFPFGIKKPMTQRGIAFQCADATQNPDVVIEVLGRERRTNDTQYCMVHLRMTAGDYTSAVSGGDDAGQWHKAAYNAARHIRTGMIEHYEELIAHRVNLNRPA
jgi:hypothetical protein